MARDILDCPANISDEMLSGWRDFPPSPSERARIHEHVAACPACQRRQAEFELVASALLRQREIEPGERILSAVRQPASRVGARSYRVASRRVWSGLGALAAIAAVVLLFVYVFGGIAGRSTSLPTATRGTGKTPIASQTLSPAPTLPPAPALAPVVDARAAWGAHAAATFNTRLDATHVFEVGGITPDGLDVLGYRITLPASGQIAPAAPAEAGFVNISTRQFTSIGLTDWADFSYGCCMADGHYLLMVQDVTPQATCSVCDLAYWSYDMDTDQKYLIAKGTDFQTIEDTFFSHGLLVMWTGEGVKVADLATHAMTAVPGIPASARPSAFSWPYLLYMVTMGDNVSSQTRVRNLSTGQDLALPQVDGDNVSDGTVLMLGDTLFVVESQPALPGTPTGSTGPTTLYQLDAFTNPDATLKAVATYSDTFSMSSANARLILISSHQNSLAWDRAEGRFVSLGSPYILSGNYLIGNTSGTAGNGSVPTTVSIFDTTKLPVLTGG